MRNWTSRITLIAVCGFVFIYPAEGKQVRGFVADSSGAVVVGATVSVFSSGEEIVTTRSNEQGRYSLSFAESACLSCQLTCSAPGFASVTRELDVTSADLLSLTIPLSVAGPQESISVGSEAQPWHEQLDLSEVRESAARDVGEALTQVDGVNKIRRGGIDNDIVVRGFQQNDVNVSIDGARIYGACPNHMDPPVSHTDFSEVERVDVQEGAFDVTSSGSLGAKVDVVTRKPPLGLQVVPSFAFGSYGFYNPSITASFGNSRLRVLGGYSYRVAQPFKDGQGKSFLTTTNYNAAAWNQHAFDFNTGWLEVDYAPTDDEQLSLRYTAQASGVVLYPYLTMDAAYDHADIASFKYEIRNLASLLRAIRLNTYFTQVTHAMDDTYRTSSMNGMWMMYANARSMTAGGALSIDLSRELTLGAEGYYRNWNMIRYMKMGGMMTNSPLLPDVGTDLIGAYATYHHAFSDRLNFTAGARFDHAGTSANTPNLNTSAYYVYQNTRQTGASESYGSGNARLSYTVAGNLELFAGVGTTGRVPDGEERFINNFSMGSGYVGNPSLPYVRNTEETIGAIYRHGSKVYLKGNLFYSSVNNYILVNGQPQQNMLMGMGMPMWPETATSFTNVSARLYGGELTYSATLPYGFSLDAGGSYAKGGNDVKPAAGVLCTNLPQIPPLRGWTSLRYTRNYFFGEVGGVAAAPQKLVDSDLNEAPSAGWGVMNIKAGVTYKKLFASFVLENALNNYYYEYLSYYRNPFSSGVRVPEPGRNYFIQLKYRF